MTKPLERAIIHLLAVVLALTGLLLAGCGGPPEIPQGALDALQERWQSLPGSEQADLQILRAWQGELSADPPTDLLPTMEVWCFEVQLKGELPEPEASIPFDWIVFRERETAPWQATPLMVMSALWPYEACGEGP